MIVYQKIGQAFPRKLRIWAKKEVDYSSFNVNSDRLIGFTIVFGLAVGIIGGFLSAEITGTHPIAGTLLFFGGFVFIAYMWLEFSADSKSNFIEDVLPDAIQIISSNIRAGLTIDKALLMTARDEFGPLGDEIRRIGKETMAGENITHSLLKTKKKVRSKHVEMVVNLMTQSIESGGELADLLDETAGDLRDQTIIQKEVRASVLMYVFFIFIAVGLMSPIMFAVSSTLVNILSTNMQLISSEMPADFAAMGGMPMATGGVNLSPEFLAKYIPISLLITSIFGSIAMGLILHGEEKSGLKFLPILAIMSIGLYYLTKLGLDHFIGSMFQF